MTTEKSLKEIEGIVRSMRYRFPDKDVYVEFDNGRPRLVVKGINDI